MAADDAYRRNVRRIGRVARGRPQEARSADLNGDGRDEFFFAAGNCLVAVAGGQDEGKIAWQVGLPGRLSEPTFADVDADGKGEILATCADGYLYCLDQASGK